MICAKIWKSLLAPSTFFDFSWGSGKGRLLLCMWGGFLVIWVAAGLLWEFPCFPLFLIVFSSIFAMAFGTLKYFFKHMQDLNDDLAGYSVFLKARYFFKHSSRTCINILFPIAFALIFGIGGCTLYTKAQPTPTFILYMIYFVVMVYLSMVAYLQYIRFFWYLHLLTTDEGTLTELIQPVTPDDGDKITVVARHN